MTQIKFDEPKKINVFSNILKNICKTFNFENRDNKPYIINNTLLICIISSEISISVSLEDKIVKIKTLRDNSFKIIHLK